MSAQNLRKIFRGRGRAEVTALDGLSFEIKAGEKLGLVGESGSGKSTVAKIVTGLMEPTEGCVYLSGRNITRLKGRAKREIYLDVQMVFQSPAASFNPRRTLGQGVCESLLNRGLTRRAAAARAEELFIQCGLDGSYAFRYPHQVSGGEAQRAAIARALAMGPRLLICDEATSALDVTVQAQIMALLKDQQAKGNMAFLFISHNLALVQQFCDRVLVMHQGRIMEQGRPDDIIMNPRTPHTQKLVEAVLEPRRAEASP